MENQLARRLITFCKFGISLTGAFALVGATGLADRMDAAATGSTGVKARIVSAFQSDDQGKGKDKDKGEDHDNGKGNDPAPTSTPEPTSTPTPVPTEEPTAVPGATQSPGGGSVVQVEPVVLDDDPTNIVSSFDGSGNGTVAVDLDGDGVAEFTIVIGDNAGFR